MNRKTKTATATKTPEPKPEVETPEAGTPETEAPAETPETEAQPEDATAELLEDGSLKTVEPINAAAAAILQTVKEEAKNGSATPEAEALDKAAEALAGRLDKIASMATATATALRAIPAGDAAQGGVKTILNKFGNDAPFVLAQAARKDYAAALKTFQEKDTRAAILSQIAALAAKL